MPTYSLELTTNERLFLIFACGIAHSIPPIVSDHSAPPASAFEIARRLVNLEPGKTSAAPTAAPAPVPMQPSPAPAAPRQEIPEGAIELSITPTQIIKTGDGEKERLLVKWKDGSTERLANCWSNPCKPIWPRVLERVKKPTVFYAKQSGAYLNIVGIK